MALRRAYTSAKLSQIRVVFSEKLMKTDRPLYPDPYLKVNGTETNPPSKFCGRLRSSFCVMMLTNQPTNGHKLKITPCAQVKQNELIMSVNSALFQQ